MLLYSLGSSLVLHAQTYQVIIYQPPSGFMETRGEGIAGQQRVGAARIAGAVYPEHTHAFLWVGQSASPIDLNPPDWMYSRASATDGAHQVGYVEQPGAGRFAALWTGSAASLNLLTPIGGLSNYSEAFSVAGNQVVGYIDYSFCGNDTDGGGGCTYRIHATTWNGTAERRIDLHPTTLAGANSPGDQRSWAVNTDGTSQVGHAYFIIPAGGGGYTSQIRALLWHGTANSVVDLHPQSWDGSYATGVKGNTQVGYGYEVAGDSPTKALVWHGTAQSLVILGEGTILDTNGTTHVGAIAVGYNSHAFRWNGDSGAGFDLHPLLPAVYVNSGASDIDEAGNIIGWAQTESGYLVGVLWSAANNVARQRH